MKKFFLYSFIAIHVAIHYALEIKKWQWSFGDYLKFLKRALTLLLIFRHNKIVKVSNGYKLQLYLPAYPSKAFFRSIESKLCQKPPTPLTIVFSITKACGYKCQHCYQRKDQVSELDEAIMIDTAKKMQDLGVCMFDIEGGEPLLRYQRLLHLLESLDDRSEIWVNTTGFSLTEDKLLEMKSMGLFGLMISIHSPNPEKHDAFTGIKDSFKIASDAIKLCHKHKVVSAINSVLSEDEIREGKLADLMELAKELNCDYVQLIHPKPAGKWLGNSTKMQKDEDILKKIEEAHIYYNSAKNSSFPSLSAQVFEEAENNLGCTAGGIDRFYLNATGELQPCEFLNISFGNVSKENFATIFARMRETFSCPCSDWLCCTRANEIYRFYQDNNITETPLPWDKTQILIKNWQQTNPTQLYKKLGIYK